MAGLNLGVMGGVRARANASGYTGGGGVPPTATAAAFGPGYTSAGTPSRAEALAPNDPFGIAFWGGIAALGLLLLIRHSLPN